MGMAETLRQAIAALYTGAPEAQQHANSWLHEFNQQPASWEACAVLVDPAESTEVCFFSANMLLAKVRMQWHKLGEQEQAHMAALISAKFQAFLAQCQARLVLQRLGLLMAAVACATGPGACAALAGDCLQLVAAPTSPPHVVDCALVMLSAVGEEVGNAPAAKRRALSAALEPPWERVAAMVQALVPQQLAAGRPELALGCLTCLQQWLKLDAEGHGVCRASPGQLCASQAGVLSLLFGLMEGRHPGVTGAAAAEQLEALAAEVLGDVFGPGVASGPDPSAEAAALEAAARALLAQSEGAFAPGAAGARRAAHLAGVASALAMRDPDALAGAAGGAPSQRAAAAAAGHGAASPAAAGAAGGAAAAAAADAPAAATALRLAQLMLQLALQRRERGVLSAAVDYFLSIASVPLSLRPPQLGPPLFSSLAPALLRGACHPPGFVSWEEAVGEEDEDAFNRFREDALGEMLEAVHAAIGPSFLAGAHAALRGAGSWQEAEGALFCALSVAAPACRAAAAASSSSSADAAERARETGSALAALFADVCGDAARRGLLTSHPHACRTAAALVGAYAAWFDAAGEAAPLEAALGLLLAALRVPGAGEDAGKAFRALCTRCARGLAAAPALGDLTDAVAAAVAPPLPPLPQQPGGAVADGAADVPWEARSAVVGGMARVVAATPWEQAPSAGLRLLEPLLRRAQALLAGAAASGEGSGGGGGGGGGAAARQAAAAAQALAGELRLVGAVVRAMEFPPAQGAEPGSHPALRLLEAAWPTLAAAAASPLAGVRAPPPPPQAGGGGGASAAAPAAAEEGAPVVGAVCEVYAAGVRAARASARAVLQPLLHALRALWAAHLQPSCLDTLAAVVETVGEARGGDGAAAELQRAALEDAAAAADAALSRAASAPPPGLAAVGGLLRAFVSAADGYFAFSRAALVAGPAAAPAVRWAVAGVRLREAPPLKASLAMLQHLVGALGASAYGAEEARAALGSAADALAARGGELVQALVGAALDTAPRQMLRLVAGVLRQLLDSRAYGQAAAQQLLQVLQAPDLPGMAAGLLRREDCEAFARLALRQPPLPRSRFDALVADFGAIARGEGLSDALLAYEM